MPRIKLTKKGMNNVYEKERVRHVVQVGGGGGSVALETRKTLWRMTCTKSSKITELPSKYMVRNNTIIKLMYLFIYFKRRRVFCRILCF